MSSHSHEFLTNLSLSTVSSRCRFNERNLVAKKTVTTVEYTDDLDGTKAEGTVAFSFDGAAYEIDLSKANSRAFEKAMAPYVGHARKIRAARARSRARSNGKHDLSAIRAWASANGYAVAPRGRVATEVLEAFDAAH